MLFFAWLLAITSRIIVTVDDETKDTLVITVMFFIIVYRLRKRRHVSKLVLALMLFKVLMLKARD